MNAQTDPIQTPTLRDRRRYPRVMFVRPCKVRAAGRTAYLAAETTDLSAGGAMLRVPSSSHYSAGDLVELAIASRAQAVLSSRESLKGHVRRVTPMDHHHHAVAVEFQSPRAQQLPAAA